MLDNIAAINQQKLDDFGDPEIATRIAQYELAYRMQMSVPELTDLSTEFPNPPSTPTALNRTKRGTYANNCILARRLAESGVRFVQLFHMGWDQHRTLPKQIKGQCYDTDQATTALINDLDQRGMLEDTLVVGAANSVARSTVRELSRRPITVATITRVASPSSWQEPASSQA